MAQRVAAIVSNPDVLHGKPRIDGRRISVRQIVALVEETELSAQSVADRYDLDVADVYAALTYYHSHPEVMAAAERQQRGHEADARKRGAESLDKLQSGSEPPDSDAG